MSKGAGFWCDDVLRTGLRLGLAQHALNLPQSGTNCEQHHPYSAAPVVAYDMSPSALCMKKARWSGAEICEVNSDL